MKTITHATFLHAVKVGSGSSSNSFNERAYNLSISDDCQFLVVTELNNSGAVALVPMSNVAYLGQREDGKKEAKKGTNA